MKQKNWNNLIIFLLLLNIIVQVVGILKDNSSTYVEPDVSNKSWHTVYEKDNCSFPTWRPLTCNDFENWSCINDYYWIKPCD